MFIQTSSTPNPASLMFLPGEKVMEVSLSGKEARPPSVSAHGIVKGYSLALSRRITNQQKYVSS